MIVGNSLKFDLMRPKCIVSISKCCASLCTNWRNQEKIMISAEPETRLLKVGIIGTPNAGKSTLINNLMDRKVCPTSAKVHTTRSRSMAVFTQATSQIVFLDTPGLVNDREMKRFNLEGTFRRDSNRSLKEADLIGVIHDASHFYTRETLDIKIIKCLENHKDKPSFLVLNKIDILKSKRKLLDITRLLTENCVDGVPVPGHTIRRSGPNHNVKGWPYFKDIFMVSALTGDGLDAIRTYLIDNAKPGKWMFPGEVWTDQSAETLIENSVKATLLDFLPQEIPYSLKSQLEYFDIDENGVITTVVLVKSPSQKISRLVVGIGEGKLRQIVQSVQEDLKSAFRNIVKIQIVLDPPPNFE